MRLFGITILKKRIILLAILLIFGFLIAGLGDVVMELQKPIRQESPLLENYLIMQSMAGQNGTNPNLTYVIGNYGLVFGFNDIMTDSGMKYGHKITRSNQSPPAPLTWWR